MRYFIIYISAVIIEVCSTFFIRAIAQNNIPAMYFFAMIGPFLGLPFIGYMVDSETWGERIKQAVALSIGYGTGMTIVTVINK